MTEFEATEWQERLRAAVAETLRAKAKRRDERREFKARRDVGLARRHAAKFRNRQEETMPVLPPCCAEADEPPCDQHRQAQTVTGHQGLRTKHPAARLAIGDAGKARPARPEDLP